MKAVVDRIVQYANRYQLTNVETGEVLGTFDFDEVTGTVQQVGTEIDKELFDSIANDLAARVKLSGGELAGTVVTFSDISGTAENVASGDTSATLWGKVKNWFSRLKALAFKNKVAAGDFEAGAIKNADVAADAAIAQSKVSGLMTDYVASISASGRTLTFKNKSGATMGTATTQDTTYGLASQSSNGLMSSTDKTKLDGIESGAQKNTVLGVKGDSESAYRTGNVNITKSNIGLGNVDNTSDKDKPVSTATQTALDSKANTSGSYPNLTVGKATNADNATNATKATQDADGNVINATYAKLSQVVRVDAAQSLTDKEKTRAKDNLVIQTTKNHSPSTTNGWYRVAKLNRQTAYSVTIGQTYNYTTPMNIKLALNLGYQEAIITQESGIFSGSLQIDRVRVCIGTTTDAFFDVYISGANFNATRISIDRLYNGSNVAAIETYDNWENLGTADTVAGYTVTLLDLVSGTNTSGTVYQQRQPVLVGDQSAIFESDGVTVKKASKLATPRALPVNLALSSGNANKFDGSANTSLGVTGTLPVANGGTGQSNLDNVTVGNAKIAQYASSDTSKGTIEERLTNMGFKEGSVTGLSGATLTKQAKYAILQIPAGKQVTLPFNGMISFRAKNLVNTHVPALVGIGIRAYLVQIDRNSISIKNIDGTEGSGTITMYRTQIGFEIE